MKLGSWSWCIVALLASIVDAELKLNSTASTYDALTDSLTVSWTSDSHFPNFETYSSFKFLLCTGTNAQFSCEIPLGTEISASQLTGNKYTYSLSKIASQGGSGTYFVQMNGFVLASQSIYYSPRFTITSMTGSVAAVGSGAPPDDLLINTPPQLMSEYNTIPYAQQTGVIRYAPMQSQPGTSVTKSLIPSRRFETSAVSLFKTIQPSMAVYSTITPGWSYTFTSHTNYAPVMPTPSTYYDPSVIQASFVTAMQQSKAKRWMD